MQGRLHTLHEKKIRARLRFHENDIGIVVNMLLVELVITSDRALVLVDREHYDYKGTDFTRSSLERITACFLVVCQIQVTRDFLPPIEDTLKVRRNVFVCIMHIFKYCMRCFN